MVDDVLCVIVVLPGHTWVMPRAHPSLCVEEVDLALLCGSLLCTGRKEETYMIKITYFDFGMNCSFLYTTLTDHREIYMCNLISS